MWESAGEVWKSVLGVGEVRGEVWESAGEMWRDKYMGVWEVYWGVGEVS